MRSVTVPVLGKLRVSGARPAFLMVLLGLVILPSSVRSQEGAFAFQIRGGQAVPSGGFRSGEEAWQKGSGQGSSFGMGFTFPAPGPFGVFLGFGQRRFSCDDSVCPEGSDWISTGFDVALRLVMGEGRVRSWIQGGLHNHRLEGEVLGQDGSSGRITSDGGGGFEVGGGLLIGVGTRTSLSPGVRYGWGEVPFKDRKAVGLRYLIVDLGLVLGF